MNKIVSILLCILFIGIFVQNVSAHVPYIERTDYSEEQPYHIWKMIEYSKAFYAWLEPTDFTCQDIDVYQFTVREKPVNIYLELIVPDVGGFYDDFVPWYALIGPGLPEVEQGLPFDIPPQYGGFVMENVEPGTERESFFEPFGGKSYFTGPILDEILVNPGTYSVYCWDPYEMGGDYVLVVGKGEFFGPFDIIRSLINTAVIRMNGELHID